MIRSYKGGIAEDIIAGKRRVRGFPQNLIDVARRKLFMIDNAAELNDLRTPPGNRLEALRGDRRGQHAIRVNQQYRVCFRWSNGGADDVEIVDYH